MTEAEVDEIHAALLLRQRRKSLRTENVMPPLDLTNNPFTNDTILPPGWPWEAS